MDGSILVCTCVCVEHNTSLLIKWGPACVIGELTKQTDLRWMASSSSFISFNKPKGKGGRRRRKKEEEISVFMYIS